jgi:hypothetical protein
MTEQERIYWLLVRRFQARDFGANLTEEQRTDLDGILWDAAKEIAEPVPVSDSLEQPSPLRAVQSTATAVPQTDVPVATLGGICCTSDNPCERHKHLVKP